MSDLANKNLKHLLMPALQSKESVSIIRTKYSSESIQGVDQIIKIS
jgi:hypothetical protein